MTTLLTITPKWTWYVARSGGLVAWATCTASIVWGLLLSTRLVRRKGIPAWLLDLHRFLGALTLVFTGLHMLGLYLDEYAHFGLRQLFVPMASGWKPGAVAWGIAATYLLIAIEVTSLVMRKIPRRWWRAVHMSSFLMFVTATVHGFASGTDRTNLVVDWVALVTTMCVVFLVVIRVFAPRNERAAGAKPVSADERVAALRAARAAKPTPAPAPTSTPTPAAPTPACPTDSPASPELPASGQLVGHGSV